MTEGKIVEGPYLIEHTGRVTIYGRGNVYAEEAPEGYAKEDWNVVCHVDSKYNWETRDYAIEDAIAMAEHIVLCLSKQHKLKKYTFKIPDSKSDNGRAVIILLATDRTQAKKLLHEHLKSKERGDLWPLWSELMCDPLLMEEGVVYSDVEYMRPEPKPEILVRPTWKGLTKPQRELLTKVVKSNGTKKITRINKQVAKKLISWDYIVLHGTGYGYVTSIGEAIYNQQDK